MIRLRPAYSRPAAGVILIFLLIAAAPSVHGYMKDYGPFARGQEPLRVPMKECVIIEQQEDPDVRWYAVSEASREPIVKLQPNDDGWAITLLSRQGSRVFTNEFNSGMLTVLSADLNRDKRPDFVVDVWSGGCGLAGLGSKTTILLSTSNGYKAVEFYGYGFGPHDFVRFRKDGPCYYIQNDLVWNGDEPTKDGRDHSFWVYRLYRFDRDGVVEANDDPRFPKWVWYTFKENHKETDQLTAGQKRWLLEPDPKP